MHSHLPEQSYLAAPSVSGLSAQLDCSYKLQRSKSSPWSEAVGLIEPYLSCPPTAACQVGAAPLLCVFTTPC